MPSGSTRRLTTLAHRRRRLTWGGKRAVDALDAPGRDSAAERPRSEACQRQARRRRSASTIKAAPIPRESHTRSHRRVVGQPGLAAREDRRRAVARNDHDADGHRDEHGGNDDVDEDQVRSSASPRLASLTDAMARNVSTSRFGPPKPRSPAIEKRQLDECCRDPRGSQLARLPRAADRGGVRRSRRPTASNAIPRRSVRTPSTVSCESSRSTAAWPRTRPRPHAIVVPRRNPLRNAIPLVRGRSLRMTANVAVSTSGLAAAASAKNRT